MAETYIKGESGLVVDTITMYKNQTGDYVTVGIETLVNDRTVIANTIHVPSDKFRELVKDVL